MPSLTAPRYEGEFIGELAMGVGFHVDEETLNTGQNLGAGAVVGQITAGGNVSAYDNANVDGTETVYGILVAAVDATAADAPCRVLRRGPAVINKNDLEWAAGVDTAEQDAAILEMLANLNIKAV